ncbi:hypothetical protein MGYG_08365 [Nannizzia gypsea CBS 118893]|uniref:Uncharacterized protein n=1 Tax=Arthroderma gypseum (strain ATCC MYA-4604 / CBS 118893) TaxID=535722 RepID=E4V5H9_ARTGP|nr:hypothetical protein MGYG_08365 [Nannizzia gypsea CBS 118893]EFR05354.1 hypothetical protein MGYG_08365 [Nannizzia gypsea CBS 118893]
MPIVNVIMSRRKKYYAYDEEAFHYYNGYTQTDDPSSVIWIVKPYFQNCKIFLLKGAFRLLSDERLISEPGRAYRVKDEDRIGLCGSTAAVVVIEEDDPGTSRLPNMTVGHSQCLIS